ncbi:hypothetical protein BDV34DRAFT_223442 [Aspergillus parasiticus]|uniref:Uncharacterized protein n=1 Tax=Aspergillus parasiticus TaxID=5067 RepID=A0A5N6DQX9_ASPPA|nr:hypothetical protein BDV34DRAFT_223442 [Aspergillus parasiticus]
MSTAESLLELARNARAECNTGQRKFSTALPALDALVSELEVYKSVMREPVKSEALTNLESHLTPCAGALNALLIIRRKYRSEMSTFERAKWKTTDGEKFTDAVNGLQNATNLLRGTLRMTREVQLHRTAETKPKRAKEEARETTTDKTKANAKPDTCRNGAGCRAIECKYSHPDAEPCRYGAGCTNSNCAFRHPKSRPCRSGAGCRKLGCTFAHPQAPDCRYGVGCTNTGCSFKHPSVPACRDGVNCVVNNCKFFHPEVKPCRFGTGCTNKNCTFRHPAAPPPYTKEPTASVKSMDVKESKEPKNSDKGSSQKAKRKPKVKKSSVIPEKETCS